MLFSIIVILKLNNKVEAYKPRIKIYFCDIEEKKKNLESQWAKKAT